MNTTPQHLQYPTQMKVEYLSSPKKFCIPAGLDVTSLYIGSADRRRPPQNIHIPTDPAFYSMIGYYFPASPIGL